MQLAYQLTPIPHIYTKIKKIVNIPIVCAGKMTPIVAANAIKNNEIDAMGVARQFLVDKEWVTKLINDKIDEIHPCIHCHNGCFNMAHYNGVGNDQTLSDNAGMARCALNPETMQSKKYKIIKTKTPKKVAIIGGGIGNLIDRIFYGYVIDYLSLSFFPPVCNFADYCITVGAVLLVLYIIFFSDSKNRKLGNKTDE